MSSFSLNVTNYRNYNSELKARCVYFLGAYSQFFNKANEVSNCWRDNDALVFLEMIKKENKDVNVFFDSVDKYVNLNELFLERIEDVFGKYGVGKIGLLEYNSNNLQSIISIINDSILPKIDSILNVLKTIVDPYEGRSFRRYYSVPDSISSSSAFDDISGLYSDYKEMKDDLMAIVEAYNYVTNSIDSEINDSKVKIREVSENFVGNNQMTFVSNVIEPVLQDITVKK